MRHLAKVAMLLAAVVAVGCNDDNPNEPSETPPTFTFALTTAQEVPPVTGAEAGASGTVTIKLNLTRDAAQTITAATVDFETSLSGFPAGSVITLAHIHEAPAGVNAGFVVNTGITSGNVTLTNGAGSFTRNGVATTPEIAQRILNGPGGFYYNVHSALNPTGVVRGQLVRTD